MKLGDSPVRQLLHRFPLRSAAIIALLTFLGWRALPHSQRLSEKTSEQPSIKRMAQAAAPAEGNSLARTADLNAAPAVSNPLTPLAQKPRGSINQIFRIVFNNGSYTLDSVHEVSGNFGKRRDDPWSPGMLYFKLSDSAGRLIAAQVVRDPGEPCLVLDESLPGATSGAAQLASVGPTLFQVNFAGPVQEGILQIYRITVPVRPNTPSESLGDLLASFTFPQK